MAYQSAFSLRFRSKWKIRLNHKLGLVASGTQTFISAGGPGADNIYLPCL